MKRIFFETRLRSRKEQEEAEVEMGEQERIEWQVVHEVRKRFVWSLIAVFGGNEEGETGQEWSSGVGRVIERVSEGLRGITKEIIEGTATPPRGRVEGANRLRKTLTSLNTRQRPQGTRPSSLYVPSPNLLSSSSHSSEIVITPNSPTRPSQQTPIQTALSRLNGRSTSSSSARQIPNFAPPSTLNPPESLHLESYESSHQTLSHSISQLSQTLNSILSQTRHLSPLSSSSESLLVGGKVEVEDLLNFHDGIKFELESIAREWAQSRISLRLALGVELNQSSRIEQSVGLGIEGSEMGARGEEGKDEYEPPSPPTTDPNASLDDGTELQEELDLGSRQALIDAALSLSLSPNQAEDDGKEKVFEAIVGEREKGERVGNGEKVSREERIKRMREAREALEVGKKVTEGKEGEEGGMKMQLKMVGELREVLKGLGKGFEE